MITPLFLQQNLKQALKAKTLNGDSASWCSTSNIPQQRNHMETYRKCLPLCENLLDSQIWLLHTHTHTDLPMWAWECEFCICCLSLVSGGVGTYVSGLQRRIIPLSAFSKNLLQHVFLCLYTFGLSVSAPCKHIRQIRCILHDELNRKETPHIHAGCSPPSCKSSMFLILRVMNWPQSQCEVLGERNPARHLQSAAMMSALVKTLSLKKWTTVYTHSCVVHANTSKHR